MIEEAEWKAKISAAESSLAAEAAEVEALIQQQQADPLRFCLRLLAVVRVILHDHKNDFPHVRWSVAVVALFTKMVSVLRGALTLAHAGHGRELPIMIRPAEALITLTYIAQQDRVLRTRRWAQFAYISKYKLMQKHPQLFKGPANRNIRRRVRGRAKRAKPYFPRDFWGSGLGCQNLREMANKVGLLWHYDTIY